MNQAILSAVTGLIQKQLQEQGRCVVAIDGRCASGKTTLAARLQDVLQCGVVHMDHFFLRTEQRTAERLNQPGGNIDWERFNQEAVPGIKSGESFCYRPFDCGIQALGEPVWVKRAPVLVVEGSYSCHPALEAEYGLKIFLSVSRDEQLRRIRMRNGEEKALQFARRWIPMEEQYFEAFCIRENCNAVFLTDD